MGALKNLLSQFFQFIHGVLTNIGVTDTGWAYVLAIALLTIIIKIIFLPLNIKQMRSQAKMQEIQPEVQRLQTKYKNDPQKAQAEMMRIYKENGVSPLSGCLPLLIQMPILFALFYVFNELKAIQGVSFLWLPDLYSKDPLYILPILSGLTTYLSSYMTSKTTTAPAKDGEKPGGMNMGGMNIGMSIFMTVMSFNFKSALVLYWVLNNALQMLQTYFIVILPAKKKAQEAK
ncbi:protein translocase subunit yidC [Clostridium amylolyticum]|uniref:Protein translocase subunit yidC n=1 Tax=Clostridium amylolyticum TaxID=1121298 RepID=A0A1M6FV38_9CLOT|nr:membrane protein insertase YidC [Clostridium amylolyticum]SHJ01510.1 protein translocase subunit yidC [Clostridium amylolyticum]